MRLTRHYNWEAGKGLGFYLPKRHIFVSRIPGRVILERNSVPSDGGSPEAEFEGVVLGVGLVAVSDVILIQFPIAKIEDDLLVPGRPILKRGDRFFVDGGFQVANHIHLLLIHCSSLNLALQRFAGVASLVNELNGHAAIGHDIGSGDIAGLLGGQKKDNIAHFQRFLYTTQRDVIEPVLTIIIRILSGILYILPNLCIRQSRTDCISPNAIGREFDCQRAGHHMHIVLQN